MPIPVGTPTKGMGLGDEPQKLPSQREVGEWYQGPDGFWYCWPSRDAYPIKPQDMTSGVPADISLGYMEDRRGSGGPVTALEAIDRGIRERPVEIVQRERNVVALGVAGVILIVAALLSTWAIRGILGGDEDDAALPDRQRVQALRSGFTVIPLSDGPPAVTYAAVFMNESKTKTAVQVRVVTRLVDAAGALISEEALTVPTLLPRQQLAVADTRDDLAAPARLVTTVDVGTWVTSDVAEQPVRVTSQVSIPESDGLRTVATITSTLADPADVRVVFVYVDDDGKVLGGGRTQAAGVAAGSSEVEYTARYPIPGVDGAQVFAWVVVPEEPVVPAPQVTATG